MPSISVTDYYANKAIFVTGATGFIGKVLVEKLLRSCPDIKVIYLLMRQKRGMSAEKRLEDFVMSRAFDRVRDNPATLKKLRVIPGDIVEDQLGMSEEDRTELHNECQIVFHSAACVRFDMGLRDAVKSNVIGTLHVLNLAEGMNKLEVFINISTSFCHDEQAVVEEKIYPSKHKPQAIMDCVQWMTDRQLEIIQPELIKPYPNTYGYTKCLTESLVSQYSGKFTIAIARPSVVAASLKEPIPGWIDNINGPSGFIYAGARGVIHTSYCKDTTKVDSLPVDLVVNGCILLAYVTGVERPTKIRVCNITQSGINEMTWTKASDLMLDCIREYPLSLCMWYPCGSAKNYRLQHKIYEVFLHKLPAYFIDLILFLLGRKTFMIRVEKKISKGMELFEYYGKKTWVFKNEYFRSLRMKITREENEIFFTDIAELNIGKYLTNYVLGMREFVCKEDMSTLPQARRLLKRLYYLHITVKTLFYFAVLYLLYVCVYKFLSFIA